jgi:hypothetical protein
MGSETFKNFCNGQRSNEHIVPPPGAASQVAMMSRVFTIHRRMRNTAGDALGVSRQQ